jgi:hypothetical protein
LDPLLAVVERADMTIGEHHGPYEMTILVRRLHRRGQEHQDDAEESDDPEDETGEANRQGHDADRAFQEGFSC